MSAYAVAVVSGAKLVMVSSSLEGFPYFRFGLIVLSDCCEKVVDSKHNRNVENMNSLFISGVFCLLLDRKSVV